MSKKSVPQFAMFGSAGADLSAASTTSTASNVQQYDNIGILLSWTGTSPVGVVTIECSSDYVPNVVAGTWVSLDFGSAISISGNSGTHMLNINQLPFVYIRAKYTKTSGVGTLIALLSTKELS